MDVLIFRAGRGLCSRANIWGPLRVTVPTFICTQIPRDIDTVADHPSTWVIIPVHNRRRTTLGCLDHLRSTQEWDRFEVVVVDDGSTDGTGDAVRDEYPDVTLLPGDGSLWWGGAVKRGMEHAMDQGAEVIVWLNDDVLPEPGSVTELAAKVADLGDTVLTSVVHTGTDHDYTTRNEKTRWGIEQLPYEMNKEIQLCDATAGKFTAFPRRIVEAIGLPDETTFPHHHCDYDYTLRATEAGFDVGVYSAVAARDTAYEIGPPRLSSELSFEAMLKNTFIAERHDTYTLQTVYRRHRRFYGPPRALAYLAFSYRFVRSMGAIFVKFLLCLADSDQKLRET